MTNKDAVLTCNSLLTAFFLGDLDSIYSISNEIDSLPPQEMGKLLAMMLHITSNILYDLSPNPFQYWQGFCQRVALEDLDD